MGLHLAQARVLRERGVVLLGEPGADRVELAREPVRERDRLGGRGEDEAGGARDPIGEDEGAEVAGLGDRLGPAVERSREPALGVGERDEDGVTPGGRLSASSPPGSLSSYSPSSSSSGPTTETGITATPVSISCARAQGSSSIPVTSPSRPSASWRALIESASFLRGHFFALT